MSKIIERNKHPAGRPTNMLFGLCCVVDGLVRVFSLGHAHTRLTLSCAKWQALRSIKRTREQACPSSNP